LTTWWIELSIWWEIGWFKHLSKPTERAPDLSASLTRLILLPYAVRADLGLVERVERVVLRTRRNRHQRRKR
jgi:hypothetical protein